MRFCFPNPAFTCGSPCGMSKMRLRSIRRLQNLKTVACHYTPEEKVAILRRHLLEQVPISELCDKNGLQPTVFYRWQKEFFENGAAAFQPRARPSHSADQERIAYLEKKIQTKDEVLAELMAEHVALKKTLGEL
jgi:transposase